MSVTHVYAEDAGHVVDLAIAYVHAGTEQTFDAALARALVEFEPGARFLALAVKGRSKHNSGSVTGAVGTVDFTVEEDGTGRRFQIDLQAP